MSTVPDPLGPGHYRYDRVTRVCDDPACPGSGQDPGPIEIIDLPPKAIIRRRNMARPVLSPKFHGAWLGAVGGVNIGGLVVGLLESYVTHKALPLPLIDLITTVTGAVVAAVGSYVAPLLGGLTTKQLAAVAQAPESGPAAIVVQPSVPGAPGA